MKWKHSTRRRLACIATVVALATVARGADASEEETLRRATDQVIEAIGENLGSVSSDSIKHVAVIPLRGDVDGYATDVLQSTVTRTKLALFTRSEATWNELLREIEWGVHREDTMNPETVQKFGRIEGVDAILYGRIWDRGVNLWSILGRVKMSVHLAEVETGQIVWSSGPVEGFAYMHWSDAAVHFWRYPLLLLAVLLMLMILALVVRRLRKAYRPLPSVRAD